MGPKEDPRKAELENGRLGLPPNQSLVSASEVAPTTNAADEVALAVKRAKGGVLQMARVTSEVVMLPLLPVAGRRNGVSAASARTAGSGEAKRRQSIEASAPQGLVHACTRCTEETTFRQAHAHSHGLWL